STEQWRPAAESRGGGDRISVDARPPLQSRCLGGETLAQIPARADMQLAREMSSALAPNEIAKPLRSRWQAGSSKELPLTQVLRTGSTCDNHPDMFSMPHGAERYPSSQLQSWPTEPLRTQRVGYVKG